MPEARATVQDLLRRCADLRIMVVTAPAGRKRMREALYALEDAVHAVERALADRGGGGGRDGRSDPHA